MNAFLAALLLAQAYYTPREAHDVFAEANAAYARGEADIASESYERLLAHGYGGANVHYNLGTAYLSQDKIGPAILHLENALRAGGGAPDLDAQLALARARRVDQVEGAELDDPLWQRIVIATPRDLTAWAFVGLWAIGMGFLLLRRVWKGARRPLAWMAVASWSLAAVPVGIPLALHLAASRLHEGVIVTDVTAARELPSEQARVAFEVHAGLKVRLLDNSGAFVRIRLPNGLEGWTLNQGIGKLDIPSG